MYKRLKFDPKETTFMFLMSKSRQKKFHKPTYRPLIQSINPIKLTSELKNPLQDVINLVFQINTQYFFNFKNIASHKYKHIKFKNSFFPFQPFFFKKVPLLYGILPFPPKQNQFSYASSQSSPSSSKLFSSP